MRIIKALGGATAMALCLIAFVGVASASADVFKVSIEPGKWNGVRSGEQQRLNFGETYECTNASFTGETKTKSFEKQTVSPELGKCLFRGVSYVNWTMNGCKYVFHAGGGSGTMDIAGCEKPMTVEASGCRIEIGNQGGLGPVTYKNSAKLGETITASAGLSGITYTRSGCASWPNGTFSNGTYSGSWTISDSTTTGIPGETWIESAAVPPISHFSLEEAPATLAASSIGVAQRITSTPGMETSCESFTLNGTATGTSSETLTLFPTYKHCTIGGKAVADNYIGSSCNFVIHANGKFDIAGTEDCTNGKLSMTGDGCSVQFPPQTGLSGVTYSRQGWGKQRTITLGGTVTGLKYTTGGPFCSKGQGTFNDGTISLSGTLKATNSGGVTQGISME